MRVTISFLKYRQTFFCWCSNTKCLFIATACNAVQFVDSEFPAYIISIQSCHHQSAPSNTSVHPHKIFKRNPSFVRQWLRLHLSGSFILSAIASILTMALYVSFSFCPDKHQSSVHQNGVTKRNSFLLYSPLIVLYPDYGTQTVRDMGEQNVIIYRKLLMQWSVVYTED